MQINRRIPIMTYVLIAMCVMMFAVEFIMGGSGNTQVLYALGAKEPFAITGGEWWRLVMPMFLHSGIYHIAFNMFALFIWGRNAEAFLGRGRFLAVYLLSGFMGCCMSYAFSPALSVGASGSIFGIFGSLLYFRLRHKEIFNRVFGTQVIIIIGINVANGFMNRQIDNFGHIGGLLGGFLASYAAGLLGERRITAKRALAALGLAVLCIGFLLFGYMRYAPYLGLI